MTAKKPATKRPVLDWEAIEREYRAGKGRYKPGEAGAVDLIKLMLSTGRLEEAFDLPPIAHAEQEFNFPKGRADFVLFHEDGTATIIEVKHGGLDDRIIMSGIGQLMMYGVQMGYSRVLRGIRLILAASVIGRDAVLIDAACEMAGVQFMPLGSMVEHEIDWARIMDRHAEEGHEQEA